MSMDQFERCLAVMNLPPNEREWFPKWLGGYQAFPAVAQSRTGDLIPVELDLVIGFLRSLRDQQVQAWRRLQAARAIEVYHRGLSRCGAAQ